MSNTPHVDFQIPDPLDIANSRLLPMDYSTTFPTKDRKVPTPASSPSPRSTVGHKGIGMKGMGMKGYGGKTPRSMVRPIEDSASSSEGDSAILLDPLADAEVLYSSAMSTPTPPCVHLLEIQVQHGSLACGNLRPTPFTERSPRGHRTLFCIPASPYPCLRYASRTIRHDGHR